MTHRKADNAAIQSFAYEYDFNDNIEAREENGASTQFAESYEYDSKGNVRGLNGTSGLKTIIRNWRLTISTD